MNADEWRVFLDLWESKMRAQYARSDDLWDQLGLPALEDFEFFSPIDEKPEFSKEMALRDGAEELLSFYSVTNGWPLFMGEDLVAIAPIKEIGWFQEIGSTNFEISSRFAPEALAPEKHEHILSVSELSSAVLLSRPILARELLLWLESGEVCLYLFEDVIRFESLSSFMKFKLDWFFREFDAAG